MSDVRILFPAICDVLSDEVESFGLANSETLLSRYEEGAPDLYTQGDPRGEVAAMSAEAACALITGAIAIGNAFLGLWQQWKKTFPANADAADSDVKRFVSALEKRVSEDDTLQRSRDAKLFLTSTRSLLRNKRGTTLLLAFIKSARETNM